MVETPSASQVMVGIEVWRMSFHSKLTGRCTLGWCDTVTRVLTRALQGVYCSLNVASKNLLMALSLCQIGVLNATKAKLNRSLPHSYTADTEWVISESPRPASQCVPISRCRSLVLLSVLDLRWLSSDVENIKRDYIESPFLRGKQLWNWLACSVTSR